jgi:hypothetical protein
MPKKVNFELIEDKNSDSYRFLADIRKAYHKDLDSARIVLAWRTSLKPDVDGHITLGKCVKVTDLHKELADYDFIILLNREVWESKEFTADKKRALIDHELCHAARAKDKNGPKVDDRSRPVWRTRKHDIEEFSEVVARHGCYKSDLEQFAKALLGSKQGSLLKTAAD